MSSIEQKYVELVESLIAQLGGTPISPNDITNNDHRFTQLVAQAIPLLVQMAAGGAGATLPGDIVVLSDVQTSLVNVITGLGGTPSDPNNLETLFSEWAIAILSYVQDQGGTLANGAVIASLNGLIADLGGTVAESTGNGTTDATVAIATLRPLLAALKSSDGVQESDTPPPPPPTPDDTKLWRHKPSKIEFYYDFDFAGDEYWVSTNIFPITVQGLFKPEDFPGNDEKVTVPLLSMSYPFNSLRHAFEGYSIMGALPFDALLGQPLENRAAWKIEPYIYYSAGAQSQTKKSDWTEYSSYLGLTRFEHERFEESWTVGRYDLRDPIVSPSPLADRNIIIAARLQKDPAGPNDPKTLRLSMTFNFRYLYKP